MRHTRSELHAPTLGRSIAALALAATALTASLLAACGGGDHDEPAVAAPQPRAYSLVTTLAGSWGSEPRDSLATPASFDMPLFVAADGAGNLFVADTNNNKIRRVLRNGQVNTLTHASINQPRGIARDAAGTLYVVAYGDNTVLRVDTRGYTTLIAGSSTPGDQDGTGSAAGFRQPEGIAVAADGTLYVADTYNHKIRKITPAGEVTTLAGSNVGSRDGIGSQASFDSPTGITLDASGRTLYIGDSGAHKIRQINLATREVSTLAGTGSEGSLDAVGTAASFIHPQGVTLDASGSTLYVADYGNHKIRKITLATGAVGTLAGSGRAGAANGAGTAASFDHPFGLATGTQGQIYVADSDNHLIRQITPEGVVSTWAGSGTRGDADNGGLVSQPMRVATDLQGNAYVLDISPGIFRFDPPITAIRKVTPDGIVSTLADPSKTTSFGDMLAMAADAQGNVYISDAQHHIIHRVSASGAVTQFAGSGSSGAGDGVGLNASFLSPLALATDPDRTTLYVADAGNRNIRKIALATGAVSTLAGPGIGNYREGSAESAPLAGRNLIAADAGGNVHVLGQSTLSISKINVAGVISVVAGSGAEQSVDGSGLAASFSFPAGIAVDRSGTLYVAEYIGRLRQITPAGDVSTLVGRTVIDDHSGSIVDGPLADARLTDTWSIAIDAEGRLIVTSDFLVRRIQ